MERDFELRMADVENVLLEMERRGNHFFDDTMRIGRVMDLLNRSRVQEAFERQVVADAPQQIERKVGELIDWMIDADLRHWQGVTAHLAKRRQQYAGQLIDNPDTERFHFDRRRMIDSVGREAQRVVDGYDRQKEASELADGARNAVATAAAVGAGAVGLGAIVTIAASTAAADVTGLVMASLLAAIGFFVIPAKRKKGKDQMRQKIMEVRQTPRRGPAGAIQERNRQGRRADPRQHRAVQPIRARGGRKASVRVKRTPVGARRPHIAQKPHREREVGRASGSASLSGPFHIRQKFCRCFHAHSVTKGGDEMSPIVGDDDRCANRASDFGDMRVVDAAAGDAVSCRRLQHRSTVALWEVVHAHSREHLVLQQKGRVRGRQAKLRGQSRRD